MRIAKYLLILAAFLIMISSSISLFQGGSRTAVYVNVGAMAALAFAVGIINFKNTSRNNM